MKDDNEHDEDENTIRHSAGIISLGILAVIVAVIALAACPFAVIWAINGLFDLKIPYDFFHWSCAAVLLIMFRADMYSSKRN